MAAPGNADQTIVIKYLVEGVDAAIAKIKQFGVEIDGVAKLLVGLAETTRRSFDEIGKLMKDSIKKPKQEDYTIRGPMGEDLGFDAAAFEQAQRDYARSIAVIEKAISLAKEMEREYTKTIQAENAARVQAAKDTDKELQTALNNEIKRLNAANAERQRIAQQAYAAEEKLRALQQKLAMVAAKQDQTIARQRIADQQRQVAEINRLLNQANQEYARSAQQRVKLQQELDSKRAAEENRLLEQRSKASAKQWHAEALENIKKLPPVMGQAEQASKKLDKELKEKPKDVGGVTKAFGALGDVAKFVFGSILGLSAVVAIRKFIDAAQELINSGYELYKSIYRAGVAIQSLQFRGINASAAQTVAWVKELRKEFGTLSEREAVDVVATTQLLTRNLGFTEEQIKNVIKVSTALAIVQGKDVAESARQLVLFFSSGYGEGLQKAGIAVNRFTVAQEAMRMGFGSSYMALTEQERAAAAYNLVMKQTGEIVKAAGNYQETAAGQIDMMTKSIETQQAMIGTKLLPLKQQWLSLEVKFLDFIANRQAIGFENQAKAYQKMADAVEKQISRTTDPEKLKVLQQRFSDLNAKVKESQDIANSYRAGETIAQELDKATEASERAYVSFKKFSDAMQEEMLLEIQVSPEDQKVMDELRAKVEDLKKQSTGIEIGVEFTGIADEYVSDLLEKEEELKQKQVQNGEQLLALENQINAKRREAQELNAELAPDLKGEHSYYQSVLNDLDRLQAQYEQISQEQITIPIQLDEIDVQKKIAETQEQLDQTRFQAILDMDTSEAVTQLTDLERRVTELQNKLDGLKIQVPTVSATREIDQLNVEMADLSKYSSILSEKFDIQLPETIPDTTEEIKNLNDELERLQKAKDVTVKVGMPTTQVDNEIQQMETKIRGMKVMLAVQLGLTDKDEIDAWVKNVADDWVELFSVENSSLPEQMETVKKLNEELEKLQSFRDLSIKAGADTTEIDAEIQAKVDEINQTRATLKTTLEIDDAQLDALMKALDFDVKGITEDILKEWEDYTAETVKINQEMKDDVVKIYADLNAEIAKIQADLVQDIADVQRGMQESLADAAEKYRENEWKAERDYQEKMRRLREGFLFNLEDALRERDAVQIMRLYRQYALDTTQAKRQYEQEKEDRRRAYQQEIADIRKQAARRIEELRREAAQKIEEAKAEADKESELRRQQADQETADAREKYLAWLEERLGALAYQLLDEYNMEEGQVRDILRLLKNNFGKGGKSSVTWDEYKKIVEKAMQAGIDKLQEYKALEKEILAIAQQIAATQASTPYPSSYTGDSKTGMAGGGYAGYGSTTLGEQGYEFVLNHSTTTALEKALGGNLTQGNVLAAMGGSESKISLEVWLTPGLEAEIVDKAVDSVADTFDTVIRRR